jgi:DNA polymerase-4
VLVATGSIASRGVVMAASYEAREYGVRSALPLAIAHRRCPQAILIPRDMTFYRRASARVMQVLHRFSDRVEVAGLDEAYLDLSDCPAPKARARRLKREMLATTRLVCSVGLGPNKLCAKIASDLDKPDGRGPPCEADSRCRPAHGPAVGANRDPHRGRARVGARCRPR